MSIIQTVVWIAVIYSIVKKVKKTSAAKSTQALQQNAAPKNTVPPVSQMAKSAAPKHGKPTSTASVSRTSSNPAAVKNTKPINTKQEKSTTQLLQEKAMLDEAEHNREKRLQEIENERIHGKLNYAQRLWIGDPIPKGKRLVYCAYCNAENLVPAHDYSTKYNCYFCREIL